jgi:hypothetical protein
VTWSPAAPSSPSSTSTTSRAPGSAAAALDRAAERASFDAVQPAFLEGVTRFGDLVPARLRAWARWAAAAGITRRPADVGTAFAPGF